MSTKHDLIIELLVAGERLGAETIFFHSTAAESLGLHTSDVKALHLLLQHGPMESGQLAHALGLTPGTTTSLVDRLHKANFVHRVPVPEDRRKVAIMVNPARTDEATKLYQAMIDKMSALHATYTKQELTLLLHYQHAVAEIMHSAAIELQKQKGFGESGS